MKNDETVDIDENLRAAVQAEDIEGMRHALDAGADPNKKNSEGIAALHYAALWDDEPIGVAMANLLIERGADVDLEGDEKYYERTPLCLCAIANTPSVARILLEHGADINGVNSEQEALTPFQWAVHQRKVEMIRLLVESGADVNGRSAYEYNLSPLGQAVAKGHMAVFRLLLDLGANVSYQTDNGGTALHMACAWYQEEAVAELIAHGADMNAVDKDGQTPLISTVYAEIDEDEDDEEYLASKREYEANEQARIERGDPVGEDDEDEEEWDEDEWPKRPTDPVPVVQLLLAHGARADAVNAKGRTALDYARRPENAEFRERLEALLTVV